MNCKHCDYPLWNLRSRQCPECGSGFRPSEFRFAINSVRYACPHCGQDYYGTAVNGHLEPRFFSCVGCGDRIDMDEMVLLPTEGVDERQTHADINPWLDEDRRFLARWFQTVYRGACTPMWLLRSTSVDSDTGSAWAFAVLSHMLFGLVMVAPIFLLMIMITMGGGGAGGVFGALMGLAIGAVVVSMIALGVWVLIAHGMLRLGGPTAGGIGRTAQALCYTCGPLVFWLVPCLQIHVGWIGTLWWVIVAGFALAAAQKVNGLRAAIAVSVFPVVCGVLVLVGGVLFFSGVAASVNATSLSAARFANDESVSVFRQPLRDAAVTGAWPSHPGEFLLRESVSIYKFTSPLSSTGLSDCLIGSASLATWGGLAPSARQGLVDRAIQAMPADVVAHRLGDFVFTYHGTDPASTDPDLWLVIEAWVPITSGFLQTDVHVLTAAGAVRSFPRSQMGVMLEAQNAVRASHGLAPLPDPFSVRSGQPNAAIRPEDPG